MLLSSVFLQQAHAPLTGLYPHLTHSGCDSGWLRGLFQGLQLPESTCDGGLIESGFEGKVIQGGAGAVGFQLHEGDQAGEEVIALRPYPLGGGLSKRGVTLEALMILIDFPCPLAASG